MRAAQAILGLLGSTFLFSAQTVLPQNETVSPGDSVTTSTASVAPGGVPGFRDDHGPRWRVELPRPQVPPLNRQKSLSCSFSRSGSHGNPETV